MKKCNKEYCSWVTKPFPKPRECIYERNGKFISAKIFGLDSGNCEIICDQGVHPLLFKREWEYIEGKN